MSFAFSGNNEYVLATFNDNAIRVCNFSLARLHHNLMGPHSGKAYTAKFSSESTKVSDHTTIKNTKDPFFKLFKHLKKLELEFELNLKKLNFFKLELFKQKLKKGSLKQQIVNTKCLLIIDSNRIT